MFAPPSSSTCLCAPARRTCQSLLHACSPLSLSFRSLLLLWRVWTLPAASRLRPSDEANCSLVWLRICFSLFFFFLKLCGSWARCDLLRFPAFWSWLTGAFMHLVFPPLFPSGLLKSKIPPTTLKCANALAFFFFSSFFFPFIVRRDICTCSGCRADVLGDTLLCLACVSDSSPPRCASRVGAVAFLPVSSAQTSTTCCSSAPGMSGGQRRINWLEPAIFLSKQNEKELSL